MPDDTTNRVSLGSSGHGLVSGEGQTPRTCDMIFLLNERRSKSEDHRRRLDDSIDLRKCTETFIRLPPKTQ